MSLFFFILLGLALLGIGIFQLVQRKDPSSSSPTTQKVGKSKVSEKSKPKSSLEDESSAEDFMPILALKEAIELALADGSLSQREEGLLQDRAQHAGQDPNEPISQLREDLNWMDNPETEIINTNFRTGLEFEKYVVQKFNPKFFRLDHWAGDKFIAGRYASTTLDPDLQVTLNTAKGRFPIAVECKWRSKKEGDYIWFAEDNQLQHYQRFAKRTGKPTFIALGLGGKPTDPDEVYLIPVQAFKRGIQHHANLTHFRKPNPEQGFFFDVESGVLM